MHLSRSTFFAAVILVALLPAAADTRIEMTKSSDGLPALGQPASQETTTLWIGDGKLREDGGDESVIVDLEAKKLWIVRHAERTFNTLDLPIDIMKLVPEEMAPMIREAVAQMKIDVAVTPTEESREVAGFRARKYLVEMTNPMGMKISMQSWNASEIGFDVESYRTMMLQMASLQPAGTEWVSKLFEMEGFPVLRETTVALMGHEMAAREELREIVDAPAPDGTYAPPAGYTETPFDFAASLGQPGG